MFNKNKVDGDPLHNSEFREAGVLEKLREILLGTQRPLETVQIEVTSHCGQHCDYCPHTTMSKRWHSRHMSAETMASLWPLLRNSTRAHLQGWGEPLLHPRFFDFVAFARKAGCATSTTTCGLHLTEKMLDKIIESGLEVIAFSLVGTDAASNSPRSSNDFDEVCANISKLVQKVKTSGKGPEIHLAYLMLADRMEAVERLPELMNNLDISCTVVSTLDYLAEPEQAHLAFSPEDNEKIQRARILLEAAAEQAKLSGRMLIYALPDPLATCAAGCRENITTSLYVDAEGQISPCVYLNVPAEQTDDQSIIFGNFQEENVWSIWQKPEFKDFRQRLAAGEPHPRCQNCPKRKESISL